MTTVGDIADAQKIHMPRGVSSYTVEGQRYWYWKPGRGTKSQDRLKKMWCRLPGDPYGTMADQRLYWTRLRDLRNSNDDDGPKFDPQEDTFWDLVEAYQHSTDWYELKEKSRTDYEFYHKIILANWRDRTASEIKTRHVLELRDRFYKTPSKANVLIACLSGLFSWAVLRGYCEHNPCRGIPALQTGDGWRPWSEEDIQHFKAHAPKHMWHTVAIMAYTGQRSSDVFKMRWDDIEGGIITVHQKKTGATVFVPILPDLQAVLDVMPRINAFIANSSRGEPWTSDGWRASLRAEFAKPVMEHLRGKVLVSHGLRKSAAKFLAESGATDAEIQSILGNSKRMTQHYRALADSRILAGNAMGKWEERTNRQAKAKVTASDIV